MEELIEILQEIKDGINSINYNMEQLKDSVEELKGNGLYTSVSDVYNKVDAIGNTVEQIKGNGFCNSVADICDKLEIIASSGNGFR